VYKLQFFYIYIEVTVKEMITTDQIINLPNNFTVKQHVIQQRYADRKIMG